MKELQPYKCLTDLGSVKHTVSLLRKKMKFLLSTLKNGLVCFIFTPTLMLFLLYFTYSGQVSADTELNYWVELFVGWRYSAVGFEFTMFIAVLVCILAMVTIRTQSIPSHEKNKLGKIFNISAELIAKIFIFWSGLFFAWSFGSVYIDFVPRIPSQELMVFLCILLGVIIKYGILKLKHVIIRG